MSIEKKGPDEVSSSRPTEVPRSDINLADLETYFKFLNSHPSARFTCAFFDAQSVTPLPNLGTVHLSLPEIIATLTQHPSSTVHVTLNETNLRGRRTQDIESVRVLAVDIDRPLLPEYVRYVRDSLHPHMIVQSSTHKDGGKYHFYWKLDPTISKDLWKISQTGLAHKLTGDKNLSSLSHLIRAPGVPRVQKDGQLFTPDIRYYDPNHTALTSVDIHRMFPFVQQAAADAKAEMKLSLRKIKKAMKQANGIPPKVEVGERNETLYSLLVEFTRDLPYCTEEEVALQAEHINSMFTEPLSEEEVAKTAKSAFEHKKTPTDTNIPPEKLEEFIASPAMEFYRILCTHASDFKYQIELQEKFSDTAITTKLIERFNTQLLRINDAVVYVFDRNAKQWKVQAPRNKFLVCGMVQDVIDDTIADPKFVPSVCKKLSPQAVVQQIERMRSCQKVTSLAMSVFDSEEVSSSGYEIFDSHKYWYRCVNGIIDLKIPGNPRAPVPEDYTLSMSEAVYDSTATCPNWERFLMEVFQDNIGLINCVQEIFGYSLSGDVSEQKTFWHVGSGANGKSKVLSVLRALGGSYYTMLAPTDLGATARTKFAQLKDPERYGAKVQGKRIVILDDLATSIRLDEGLMKMITHDTLRARAEYEISRTIPNRGKLHVGTNTDPVPETENEGVIRRLCIIPYSQTFPNDPAVGNEIDRLHKAELSGILNWAITGFRRMHERGSILYGETIRESIEEYRHEHFVGEEAIKSIIQAPEVEFDGQWCSSDEILSVVNNKMQEAGQEPLNTVRLGKELRRVYPKILWKKQWNPQKNNSERVYYLKILNPTVPFP